VPPTALPLSLRQRLGLYAVLTKLRLSGLVSPPRPPLPARPPRPLDGWELGSHPGLATFLCALKRRRLQPGLGARRDARMERTRERPCPAAARQWASPGRRLGDARRWRGLLLAGTNALTGAGLAYCRALPVCLHPLKPRSSLNTLVGAVMRRAATRARPGRGMPAAGGRRLALRPAALPVAGADFLRSGWLYREDYARGGFRMLPALDPGGQLTGALSTLYSLALLPLGAPSRSLAWWDPRRDGRGAARPRPGGGQRALWRAWTGPAPAALLRQRARAAARLILLLADATRARRPGHAAAAARPPSPRPLALMFPDRRRAFLFAAASSWVRSP